MALLSCALGVWAVAHVALVVAEFRATRGWRAWLTLVFPPLAPFWALEARRYAWAGVWVFAALAYAVGVIVAAF